MKVLLLTPRPQWLIPTVKAFGDEPCVSLATPDLWPEDVDFVVSHGYRHIIREPYLSQYKNRMINLHISLLPWNRGADPNFWSWFDHTQKGVSAHFIENGVDTGPVIGQVLIEKWRRDETLRSSWEFLNQCAAELFSYEWGNWRAGNWFHIPTDGEGSFHKSEDKDPLMKLLPLGWDSQVDDVKRLGEAHHQTRH